MKLFTKVSLGGVFVINEKCKLKQKEERLILSFMHREKNGNKPFG